MPATLRALAVAARMGTRAGRRWHDTGCMTRNPFHGIPGREDITLEWTRAYMAATRPRIIPRRPA